ncbi:MAG: copper resistance protein CopC [Paraburkholderia fungorum]|nr:copper resistance protein CopC [Paraburkholderia fungorum]
MVSGTKNMKVKVASRTVCAALALLSCAAWSHAGLVKSEPGRRAALTAAPTQIRLCFNEQVEPKFSSVSLIRADAAAIELGALDADPKDPRCLSAKITGEMSTGDFTVKYKVLSVDGHVVDYGFGFSVRP